MAINQKLLDQVASSTERRVEVTVNRVTAGASNRPALYAGGGTYQPLGAEPLEPRGGYTGIQTTGAVAVGASVQDAQGIINARPSRASIREQVAAELFPTFQKVAQIVDQDPNVAGTNESGDPDKLRPRGQVDFAINVAASVLYYWDSAIEEWVQLVGGGGVLFGNVPPDDSTDPLVETAPDGSVYVLTAGFVPFYRINEQWERQPKTSRGAELPSLESAIAGDLHGVPGDGCTDFWQFDGTAWEPACSAGSFCEENFCGALEAAQNGQGTENDDLSELDGAPPGMTSEFGYASGGIEAGGPEFSYDVNSSQHTLTYRVDINGDGTWPNRWTYEWPCLSPCDPYTDPNGCADGFCFDSVPCGLEPT